MIVKIKRDAGWTYLDQIEEFRTYGYVISEEAKDDQLAPTFASVTELSPAVDRTWGDCREFAREIWPTFPEERPPCYVEAGVARRSDGSDVLVLWNADAFLLSDEGHTIDRLR